jgi:hypothetical protein
MCISIRVIYLFNVSLMIEQLNEEGSEISYFLMFLKNNSPLPFLLNFLIEKDNSYYYVVISLQKFEVQNKHLV